MRVDSIRIREYTHQVAREAAEGKTARASSERRESAPSFFSSRAPLFHYTDNSWNWGSRNVTTSNRERESAGIEWGLVLLGFVLGGVGVFYSGMAHGSWLEAWDKFSERDVVHKSVNAHDWSESLSESVRLRFSDLVRVQSKIDAIEYTNVAHRFYSMAGVAAGGISLGIGALAAAPWFVTAGSVSMFVSGLFAIWTIASHWNDEQVLHRLYDQVTVRASAVEAALNPLLHPIAYLSAPPAFPEGDNRNYQKTG